MITNTELRWTWNKKIYKIKKNKNYLKHFLEFLVVKVLYREATCRLRY